MEDVMGVSVSKSRSLKILLCGVAVGSIMQVAPAVAETASGSDASSTSAKDAAVEIVVTGTLVRGVAPAGTDVIGVSKDAVEQTGASTMSQLLQTIPQLGSFNNLQYPQGGFNTQTTNRPNLRNLPGFTTSGSAATLVLIDGHRVVGMGVSSTSPDADIIPPSLIERVEIVADGGSAIYGSDAVAGVINYITKKKFDGLQVDAHYGFGDDYHTLDASVTAGHSWDSGSAYIAYTYSEHDALYGRDRDFVKTSPSLSAGIPFPITSIECSPGNVQSLLTNTIYALPFSSGMGVPNTANQCDHAKNVTIYPSEYRHSVFAGISQDISDRVKLDVRAFYTNRHMYQSLGDIHLTEYIGPAAFGLTPSPYQASHLTTAAPYDIQAVGFAFGSGDASNVRLGMAAWGVVPK